MREIKTKEGFTHKYGPINPNKPGSHIKLPKTAEHFKYDKDYAGTATNGKGSARRAGDDGIRFRDNASFLPESPNLREKEK